MTATLTLRWALATAGAVILLGIGRQAIQGIFDGQVSDLNAQHRRHLEHRQAQWADEAAQQKLADQRAEQERLQDHHEEMIRAFGGPAAAAAKNPLTDIAGMLRGVAELCAGTKGSSRVTVDRFTEFTVTIDLDRADFGKSPPDLARCLLEHAAAYVYRLQFTRQGLVVAELDRRAIESLPSWASASGETLRDLFAELNETPENNIRSDGRPIAGRKDADEDRNMTRREQLQNRALTAFIATSTSAINQINQAIRIQANALQLEDVRSFADMKARQDQLLEVDQILANAGAFFGNPMENYRRALVGAGLDPLYIEAELRSTTIPEVVLAPFALAVIEKAGNRNRSAARLLQVMSDSLGSWSYDRLARAFQFDSSATAANYHQAAQQLKQDMAELDAALGHWTRHSKRKG